MAGEHGVLAKRPTVYELEQLARQKYPDKDTLWIERYAKMASRIIGWERTYEGFEELSVVLLFVEETDYTTRSPAKKQAIQDWREERALAKIEAAAQG